MSVSKQRVTLLGTREAAAGIFESRFALERGAAFIAGQFVNLEVPGKTLFRPLGIMDTADGVLTVCYAVVGEGTRILASLAPGTRLDAVLPLGKGFDVAGYKKILLVSGGLGCVPLYPMLNAQCAVYSLLGFSSKSKIVYADEFKRGSAELRLFTDDGSAGERGFVTDAVAETVGREGIDAVFACGPRPLFRALKNLGLKPPVFVSAEERMGCGVGACLVCACKTRGGNERVCADGPI
ncbi:MAG: dihydroorotate dehydrogenase electron transfer subunit, partial [Firmicutes bacterium]|nr:dihydroorotate dehydrogenase electron transfer subunit [Bacillota bacterium]